MTAAPWLSIVMPSFRGARWIAGALESVCAGPTEGIELIIVDGDEQDEIGVIVGSFRDRIEIRLFRRPDLDSWQAKTNFAVAQATAPHVTMLHVDDLWLPLRAASARRWIDQAPDAAFHLSPSLLIDAKGQRIGAWRCPFKAAPHPIDREQLIERLLVQNFIACPAPIIARSAWKAAGGVDESLWYTADWDLYLKLAGAGPVHYHADVVTAFRVHGGSLTVTGSRDAADFERQMQIVLERHAGRASRPALRLARASIAVNTHLASAAAGKPSALFKALGRILLLGPQQLFRFLSWSRFGDRVVPRIRLRLAGEF